MGHAARREPAKSVPKLQRANCHTTYKNVTHVVAYCSSPNGIITEREIVMSRERSKAPQWILDNLNTLRRRCDTCSAPPTYVVSNLEDSGEIFTSVAPETSYGIPFRWSASRMLAADLKSLLCGSHHNTTAACESLVNTPEWEIQKFINHFFDDAEKLTDPPIYPSLLSPTNAATLQSWNRPDETTLWNGADTGWVACNVWNNTCYKGIAKSDWYGPYRTQVCMDTFQQAVDDGLVNQSTIPLDICNLNDQLDSLCRRVQSAKFAVAEANCIVTGECLPRSFFYSPGMYSTSNQGFVREAVAQFYDRYAADATFIDGGVVSNRVCKVDPEEEALRIRNNKLQKNCASVLLQTNVDNLEGLRSIVDSIVKIIIYTIQVFVTLLKMIWTAAEKMASVLAELEYWFIRLWGEIVEIVRELGNMMFRLIFDDGSLLKELIKLMCRWVNDIINAFSEISCFFMNTFVIGPVRGYRALLDGVSKVIFGCCGISNHIRDVENTIRYLEERQCRIENINCDITKPSSDIPSGTLPIATSCWADYIPEVDDSNSLACTPSDTCKLDSLSNDETVCSMCPLASSSFINTYGCDTLTKRCTCSRPKTTRTACRY